MAYLAELAALHPDVHTREFWEYCARRELRFQRCAGCGRFRQPPRSGCPNCGATTTLWIKVTGRGRVFSYTIVHHAALPTLAGDVPYNVVTVTFDDAPGVRLVSNVLDVGPDELRIGMDVVIAWDEPAPGVVLPRFRPA
jgi:uncharacterized OB-fold protein